MLSRLDTLSGLVCRILLLVMLFLLVASVDAADSGPTKTPSRTTEPQMEAFWADLEKEEVEASRALLELSTRPEQSVAFLKDRLKPLRLDSVRLKALLLWLGSSNEALWKKAFEDLEYYDPRLAMDLQSLMDHVTETPARQRLVEVMIYREPGSLGQFPVQLQKFSDCDFNFTAHGESFWAEPKVANLNYNRFVFVVKKRKWTRSVRAIVLLEHMVTPDAVAILKDMATGHPEAQPTRAARESLDRLATKPR